MSKWLKYALVFLLFAATIFAAASFYLADDATTIWAFLSNLFLNVVAEFVGIALGIVIPLWVAVRYADKRLEDLMKPIAEFIAQLRAEERISPEAARRGMVCAVRIISQEHKSLSSNNAFSLDYQPQSCDVCSLAIKLGDDKECDYCHLKEHIWRIDNKPVVPAASISSTSN